MHITSLPGPYGIGELGECARTFIDKMESMQLSVWQFLPIGPTAYGDSPYQPLSTFAGNEMLIDIDDLIDLGLLNKSEVVELTTLPERFVDYGALIPIKTRLLNLAASRFDDVADATLKEDFEGFLQRNNTAWLHDYAVFRLLKTRHGEKPWPEWNPVYVHRDEAALRDIEEVEAVQIEATKIIQYLFFRQWWVLRDYAHACRYSAICRSVSHSTVQMPGQIGTCCALTQMASRTVSPAYHPIISAKTGSSGATHCMTGKITRPMATSGG